MPNFTPCRLRKLWSWRKGLVDDPPLELDVGGGRGVKRDGERGVGFGGEARSERGFGDGGQINLGVGLELTVGDSKTGLIGGNSGFAGEGV